jgi:putative pyruvate formate lyase activating enzyme
MLEKCELCPHRCKVNRKSGKFGRCKCNNEIKLALASLHYYEEPCISGENGSGTIFFSNCNLNCKYCQNYKISQLGKGKTITIEELANIFIKQQENKANNINLVTPTMYVEQIIEAIKLARKNGLKIPIIYNSNGYENIETVKMLNGFIDVYLPDLKYSNNELGKRYSNIDNYFEIATQAIKEMYNQVGAPILDENGIITRGLIIRHLVLPNFIENSKQVLQWIKENIDSSVYVSIMAQYFPTYLAKEDEFINRKLTKEEYESIENFVYELDFENGYMQDLGEHEEEYVPEF